MEKIKTLDDLVYKLSNTLYKHGVWLSAIFNQPKGVKEKITYDHNNMIATFRIYMNEISWFDVYKKDSDISFRYLDKSNLYYTNDHIKDKGIGLHNRLILKKPTYDEVYNFLYTYYVCPLALEKDKYNSLNKIFKRKK